MDLLDRGEMLLSYIVLAHRKEDSLHLYSLNEFGCLATQQTDLNFVERETQVFSQIR